jgi:hypothetical protein
MSSARRRLVPRQTLSLPLFLRAEQRDEFLASECRTGNTPAAFRRFREQDPRALDLRRVAGDFRNDLRGLADELLLAFAFECPGRT